VADAFDGSQNLLCGFAPLRVSGLIVRVDEGMDLGVVLSDECVNTFEAVPVMGVCSHFHVLAVRLFEHFSETQRRRYGWAAGVIVAPSSVTAGLVPGSSVRSWDARARSSRGVPPDQHSFEGDAWHDTHCHGANDPAF